MDLHFGHLYPWQILSKRFGCRLTHKLDRQFDAKTLHEECNAILTKYSLRAQHGHDHAGGWKAISLVSPDGEPYEDRNLGGRPHLKTEALKLAPYLESIVDSFECQTQRVRLMKLLPGERILWHADATESVDRINARVHIPIVTNSGVQFQISHEDCRWLPGELWYGDFSFPHRLHNTGSEGRVHVVLDLIVNDFVKNLFPKEYLDNAASRARIRPNILRMVRLYTWPRYQLGL